MNLSLSICTWEVKYITVAEMDCWCSTLCDQNKLFMFLLIFNHRVDTEMNCHITGSLIPPHTGCMRWLSVHDTEYASELKRSGYTNTCFHVTIKLLYLIPNLASLFKLCANKCSAQIFGDESRSRDTSTKIEQNEQEHRILKNEDGMVKSEQPYKSRKRRHIEEWHFIEAVKIFV